MKTEAQPDKLQVFSIRLAKSDAKALHVLAELRGIPPSILARVFIKEELRKFGTVVDKKRNTR
jgi:hypothetical protein